MRFIGKDPNIIDAYYTATAEGAITAGKPVIVEADGDVAQISQTAVSEAIGSEVAFTTADVEDVAVAYDANAGKVVIAYVDRDSSNKGTAVVGTVDPSDNSITYGTPVVFESGQTKACSIVYDANAQKVVISYQDDDNGDYGTAIVGTVSGTSISFGTAVVFESAAVPYNGIGYDSDQQKVVIAYRDSGNSAYGTAIVGTVSGTSISFGSAVVFASAGSEYQSVAYDTENQKIVIAFKDNANSNYGTAIVGTVSGTSISFGSEVVFDSAYSLRISAVYDSSAQKIVIAYRDGGSNDEGMAVVGTVSGTSISFGTPVEFDAQSDHISAAYDANAQRVVIGYQDRADNYGKVVSGTVSGTSISFTSPSTFKSSNTEYVGAAYDSGAKKVVIAYREVASPQDGNSVVFQAAHTATNLTSENYIGIAADTYADNEDSTIGIVGCIDRNQTGLTAGQQYFVQTDGTISTTAGSPSVLAGTAISATELVVKE